MQPTLPTTKTEKVETNTIDAKKAASSPYGDLEVTRYLYESGLQNIFNTYQQNVSTLSTNKQQELQDAYYIREMSKKYLGEYASNVGIGDVSGNLLDIYGQYQSNLTDIERNYDQLQMGLDQQFQQQRQKTMNELLLTEYNIEVAKLNEADKNVLFNIQTGNIPEGMTDMEYLQQEYEAGRISQEAYQQETVNLMENQRTTEERAVWGQIVRGELSKEELTAAYEAGQISVEAYNEFFNAMEQEERQGTISNIEFNIQQNELEGLNVRDYLEKQLEDGLISQSEYQDLVTKYAGDPRQEAYNEIQFNILNQSIPEGFDSAKEYIEANKDDLGDELYYSLMMAETIKEQGIESFTLYQNIINDTLPAGTTAADAIEQGVKDGLFTFEQADALYKEVSKKTATKAYNDVVFALSMGETGGLSNEDYINRAYSNGNLSEEQYQTLLLQERNKELQKNSVSYIFNLYNGEYGDMTQEEYVDYGIEQGFLTPETATNFLLASREQDQVSDFTEAYESVSAGEKTEDDLVADGFSEEEAKVIFAQVSLETTQKAATALQGYYSGQVGALGLDANGNLIEDPQAYIESIKDKLTPADLKQLQDIISLQTQVSNKIQYESQEVTYDVNQPTYTMINENGEEVTKQNPYAEAFLQLGITDFSYLSDDPNLTGGELLFFGIGAGDPQAYVVSSESAIIDEEDMLEFLNQDKPEGQRTYSLAEGKVYQYNNGLYQYKDGQFFKLTQFSQSDLDTISNIVNDQTNFKFTGSVVTGNKYKWQGNGNELDTFVYNGVEYREDTSGNQWSSSTNDPEKKKIVQQFMLIHGQHESKTAAVIFYQGTFYLRDVNGNYQKLIKV